MPYPFIKNKVPGLLAEETGRKPYNKTQHHGAKPTQPRTSAHKERQDRRPNTTQERRRRDYKGKCRHGTLERRRRSHPSKCPQHHSEPPSRHPTILPRRADRQHHLPGSPSRRTTARARATTPLDLILVWITSWFLKLVGLDN